MRLLELNSRKFSLNLVKEDGWNYLKLLDKFKADEEIALEALKTRIVVFQELPKQLKSNKEFMLKVIELRFFEFLYLPAMEPEIFKDKDIVLKIVQKNPEIFRLASKQLQEDEDVIFACLKKDRTTIYLMPEWFRNKYNLQTYLDVEIYFNYLNLQEELTEKKPKKAINKI